MLVKLMRSAIVFALLFAMQITGSQSCSAVASQQVSKTTNSSVKRGTYQHQLVAELGTTAHAAAVQLFVTADASLSAYWVTQPLPAVNFHLGAAQNVPHFLFYRLILFPFHGFW